MMIRAKRAKQHTYLNISGKAGRNISMPYVPIARKIDSYIRITITIPSDRISVNRYMHVSTIALPCCCRYTSALRRMYAWIMLNTVRMYSEEFSVKQTNKQK